MKVSVVGGGGLVGSMAAFALHLGKVATDIAIVDANEQVGQGVALDILQGTSLVADQRVVSGPIQEHIPSSDVVVVTAGLRRKPDESRLDLINRNTDLFLDLLGKIRHAGWKPGATLVVVSNPVDILTQLAVERSGLDWRHVIGLGTQLDTARLNSHLARTLKVPATQVKAVLLGEHGDSMVPIWSSATVAGMPLEKWPGYTAQMEREIFEETKTAGATMIKLKGGSGFAVGVSIREVVESILLDSRKVLPVSTMQQGLYGLRDVCLSVPTVVGAQGVMAQIEIALAPREQVALHNSARVLRETLDAVKNRLASGGSPAAAAAAAAPQAAAAPFSTGPRAIPRAAWQSR